MSSGAGASSVSASFKDNVGSSSYSIDPITTSHAEIMSPNSGDVVDFVNSLFVNTPDEAEGVNLFEGQMMDDMMIPDQNAGDLFDDFVSVEELFNELSKQVSN